MESEIREIKEKLQDMDKRLTSVEKITMLSEFQYKAIMDSIIEMKSDIKEMKSNPAKRWELIITGTITAFVGALVGLLFRGIG